MTSLVLPQICSSPHPSVLAKLPVAVRSSPRAECRRRGLRNRWVNPSHHRPPFPTPWAAAAKIAALASRCTRTVAPSLVLTTVDYIKRAADDLSDRPNILICSYWLATSIPIGCTWLDLSGRAAPCRHSPLSRQSTALAIGHTKMLAEDKKHRSLPTPTIIYGEQFVGEQEYFYEQDQQDQGDQDGEQFVGEQEYFYEQDQQDQGDQDGNGNDYYQYFPEDF